MDSKPDTKKVEEKRFEKTLSIDEFFKQLEAKEKDLDISAEMVIEVEAPSAGQQDISDFLQLDLSVPPNKPEPVAKVAGEKQSPPKDNSNLQSEITTLQNQVAKLETERIELFEISRRRQSDFENYKKRTERERGETFRNQLSNLATQMLPVVDNLNRALDSSGHIPEECSQDFKQFFEGIVLVSQQLNEIIAEMGVQPIVAVGDSFDPHFHEAVATEANADFPPHTITEELLRGYRIGDKVIRPSMVKVSVSSTVESLPASVLLSENDTSEAE